MPKPHNKERRLSCMKESVRKGISSAGDAAGEKARSARDATADGVKSVAESGPAQCLASACDSAAQIAKVAVSQASNLPETPPGAGDSQGKESARPRKGFRGAR